MLTGVVNTDREATIRPTVHGADGQEQEVQAVLDAGFSGSRTLPPSLIAILDLPWRTRAIVLLANGTEDQCDVHAATITWDGTPHNILVEAADTDPLVGMALLYGYDVRLQVVEGGSVIIEALPQAARK
ncbi:MAG: clan AA aspartic protease [Candidatus Entotheonellia bacterium]